MLWPFLDRRTRSALKPARRSSRPVGQDGSAWGGSAAERLETRRMLAADITLAGGVLTVSFDDATDDFVSLSITPTGYSATGANVTSGSGTISRLVVLDAGTVKASDLTLVQADQTLTGGLSIASNVTAARIEDSVLTNGGDISVAASCVTTFTAVTVDSGGGNQTFSGPVELLGDLTIKAAGGGDVAFSGGVNGFGTDRSLAVDAGTAGEVTFSVVGSTIAGNVAVTARNIVITADLVSTSGDISIVGDAGATVAGVFHGVHVNGSGVEVKTLATDLIAGATGAITVQGRGGDAVAAGSGGSSAYGVYLQAGASISAGGLGDVSATGIGGVSTTDSFNSGVLVSNSNAVNGVSEIITVGGDITVTGTGGGAPGAGINYGVSVNSFARIAAGGSGSVSVTGTATAAGGTGNSGVIVTNFNAASQAAPTAAITSAGGEITITGTGTVAGAAVILRNEGKVISGGTGDVTVVADSVLFDTVSAAAAGSITAGAAGDATVTIRPRTKGTLIDLGGPGTLSSPLTLGLTTDEIDRITAGTLAVGAADAGVATVSAALAPANAVNLAIRSAAGVTFGAGVMTAGGTITIDDGAGGDTAVVLAVNTVLDTTAAGAVPVGGAITIRGTVTSDTTNQFIQIKAGTDGDVLMTGTIGAVGSGVALLSLTITGNDITFGEVDGVVGNTLVEAVDGTDTGSITLAGLNYATTGGFTLAAGPRDSANVVSNPLRITGGAGSTTTITTGGSLIELSGAIELNGRNLTLDTTAGGTVPDGGGVNGGILINDAVDGAGTLTLDAGTAGVIGVNHLSGNVGGTTPLTAVTLTNAKEVILKGDVNTGTVTVTDATDYVEFAGVVVITTTIVTATQPYDLRFLGGDNGANSIAGTTALLNTGNLRFGDQGPGDVFTFVGGLEATAPAAMRLSATIAASTGVITLGDADTLVTVVGGAAIGGASTGAITLGGIQLNTGAEIVLGTGIANAVQTGAITGTAGSPGEGVTFNTTGAVTVTGAVGTGIGNLTITNSGGTTFQSTVDADLVTITDTTGTVTFQAALTAGGLTTNSQPYAVTLLGDGSTITSAATFANTGGVTLGDGGDTITFTGGLTSAAGLTTLAGTVATTDTDASFGVVTLAAATAITAGAGKVGFGDTVTGPGALAVTAAAIDVANGLGQSFNRLSSLTLTGDTTLSGPVYTAANQTYDGDVALNGTVLMNASFPSPATVRFTGLVDGDGAGFADRLEFELFNGSLVMESAVGGQDPLGSVNVQSAAGVTLGGNVTTTGQQRYNAATLSLNGTYATTDADFSTAFSPATTTTLTGNTTVATGTGNISLGNVAGDVADTRSLVLTTTGQSSLAGSGGSGRLASLTVSGGEARVGGMATSGSQSYGGDLRATNPSFLGDPVFSTAAGGLSVAGATILAANGTVSFDIQGGGLTFTGAIDNNDNPIPVSDLAINATGDVLFGAAVGGTRPPLNLSVTTPGTLTLSGNVNTWPGAGPWGVQTYAANVRLANSVSLSGLSVSFGASVDGTAAGKDLFVTMERSIAFLAPVGSAQPLNALYLVAPSISLAGAATSFSQASIGDATLAGTYTSAGGTVNVTGTTTLAGDVLVNAVGPLDFGGTVDGAHGLNVANAASVRFRGAVGGTTPLADLTVTAPTGSIDAAGVAITAGGVAFNSADQTVAAIETTGGVGGSAGTGNLTLNATGSLFAFGNLNASRNITTGSGAAIFAPPSGTFLQVTSGNGSASFGGDVTVGGAGGGLAVNTTGNITFGGGLNECGSTEVRLHAGVTGDILFRGEVRDLDALAISSAANVTAEAAISGGATVVVFSTGTVTLADVSTTFFQQYEAATVKLTGSSYTTVGNQFLIRASTEIGTGAADELVTITTSGGQVVITGGAEGIYAARPPIVPSLVGPAAIIGSGTSLAVDAGLLGSVQLGGTKGFGSGGLLGLPLADVTLSGTVVDLLSPDNLVAGTLSQVRGGLIGSGTAGNLAFASEAARIVAIAGLTPVTGYGQLTVDASGTVDLGSAALVVSASVPVPIGTILTIIDNQGSAAVSGTFAGLPEGATVAGDGGAFKVSYVGGDGNDVTLEAVDVDIEVSVVGNRVVIALAPSGTTVSNLSTRYFPGTGRLVITVAADRPLTGGGTGVTVNDAAGTVTVNLAQLPGFSGFDVVGGPGTDLITVGPGGIDLSTVARGAASQSVSITTGLGSADAVTIARPVTMKGAGPFSVASAGTGGSTGIRLGTTITAPRGPQSYLGPVTLVGATTLTGGGMAFSDTVDGGRRLTVNSTGQVVFLGDVGLATPLAGMTVQRAAGVTVLAGFRLDGTASGSKADGLVIGRNVNNVAFAALGSPSVPLARSIVGFGGSGILFQGGSTGSTIRDFSLIGNGRGITFQPGGYSGTLVESNTIAVSRQIGVFLNAARGLTLGGTAAGLGNDIGAGSASRAYSTGIFAQGNLTGTRVTGNTISLNSGNGVVLNTTRGIRIGGGPGNTITTNGGWGLIASGVSTGSVVTGNAISGNAFGQMNVRRARGLRVVG